MNYVIVPIKRLFGFFLMVLFVIFIGFPVGLILGIISILYGEKTGERFLDNLDRRRFCHGLLDKIDSFTSARFL